MDIEETTGKVRSCTPSPSHFLRRNELGKLRVLHENAIFARLVILPVDPRFIRSETATHRVEAAQVERKLCYSEKD